MECQPVRIAMSGRQSQSARYTSTTADPADPADAGPGVRRRGGRAGLGLALMGFLGIAIELVPADWSALRLVEDLDATPATAGLAFATFSVGMLVGRFAGDTLVGRVGARTALTGGSVVAGVGIATGMLAPDVTISMVGFAIAGLGVAQWQMSLTYGRQYTCRVCRSPRHGLQCYRMLMLPTARLR